MRLRCPTCFTRHELAAELIGEGRKVRCAACRESWHARPSDDRSISPAAAPLGAPETRQGSKTRQGSEILLTEDAADERAPTGITASFPRSPPSWERPPNEAVIPVETQTEACFVGASEVEFTGGFAAQGLNGAPGPLSPATATRLAIDTDVRSERFPPRRRPVRSTARLRFRLPRWQFRRVAARLCLIALPCLGMAAVAQKDLVVRLVPQTAALFKAIGLGVNLRGLTLADVHGTLDSLDGASVLTLQARISNRREALTTVPAIRIAVRDKNHRELYSWTAQAPKPRLGAGESLLFRSRLAAPPESAADVILSFVDAPPKQDAKVQAALPPEDSVRVQKAPDKVAAIVDRQGPTGAPRIETGMR